jgi:hypothetical protein
LYSICKQNCARSAFLGSQTLYAPTLQLQVAKLARQARLKEMYSEEMKAYEQELHALGLALVKPMD